MCRCYYVYFYGLSWTFDFKLNYCGFRVDVVWSSGSGGFVRSVQVAVQVRLDVILKSCAQWSYVVLNCALFVVATALIWF